MSATGPVNSYDERKVRYEYIHNISTQQFDLMVDTVMAGQPQKLLDVGCGYGAVTAEVLQRHGKLALEITLTDSSKIQLARAEQELGELAMQHNSELTFLLDDIVSTGLEADHYDVAVMKMVLHEFPIEDQLRALRSVVKVLKPGGVLVLWEMALDQSTQRVVQSIVRKKDELAGYTSMLVKRYFPRCDEIETNLAKAGFVQVEKVAALVSPVFTERRLHQEFGSDQSKLEQWEKYISRLVASSDAAVLSTLQFKEVDGHLSFSPPKAIYRAFKPQP